MQQGCLPSSPLCGAFCVGLKEKKKKGGEKVKHSTKNPQQSKTKNPHNKLHPFWQNPEHHLHNIFSRSIIYSATETFIPTRNYPARRSFRELERALPPVPSSSPCLAARPRLPVGSPEVGPIQPAGEPSPGRCRARTTARPRAPRHRRRRTGGSGGSVPAAKLGLASSQGDEATPRTQQWKSPWKGGNPPLR